MFSDIPVTLSVQHHTVIEVENVFHWSASERSAALNLVHLWGELACAKNVATKPTPPISNRDLESHRRDMGMTLPCERGFFFFP
tara:strand:- start:2559 stop:2810 length:252 start_codon:yes stop_codon:yes gene_type:complete